MKTAKIPGEHHVGSKVNIIGTGAVLEAFLKRFVLQKYIQTAPTSAANRTGMVIM